MKVVGFGGDDLDLNQLDKLGVALKPKKEINGHLIAIPYSAYIDHGSYDEQRHRPYLVLNAEICGGKGDFGDGVTEFRYRVSDRFTRTIRFDFSDEELGSLATKGLFHPDFKVPDILTDTELDVPMNLSATTVEINGKQFVYADFDKVSDLRINSKDSEYNLESYFEHQSKEMVKEEDAAERINKESEQSFKKLVSLTLPDVNPMVDAMEQHVSSEAVVETDVVEQKDVSEMTVEEIVNNDASLDEVTSIVGDNEPTDDYEEAGESTQESEDDDYSDEAESVNETVTEEQSSVPDAVTQYSSYAQGGAMGPDVQGLEASF